MPSSKTFGRCGWKLGLFPVLAWNGMVFPVASVTKETKEPVEA